MVGEEKVVRCWKFEGIYTFSEGGVSFKGEPKVSNDTAVNNNAAVNNNVTVNNNATLSKSLPLRSSHYYISVTRRFVNSITK
jgi:hypothetical protein